jgi:hypothetical protein
MIGAVTEPASWKVHSEVGTTIGFGFLVGLDLGVLFAFGVLVRIEVRLGSRDWVGDNEGVLVTGWKGVRDGFSVTVLVDVEKMLKEITRGGSGDRVGRLARVIQDNVIRLSNPNKSDLHDFRMGGMLS